MADNITSTFLNFMREMRGPIVQNYPKQFVLAEKLPRQRTNFHGKYVAVPIVKAPLQGFQVGSETGTWNEPHALLSDQAQVRVAILTQPLSISPQLIHDSANTNDTSWREAAGLLIEQAVTNMAWNTNTLLNGDGTTLLAPLNAVKTDNTVSVSPSEAIWRELYVGRSVDIRVRADGTPATNGIRRRITSVNRQTGVITFDDGGGNMSTDNTYGIYLEGSYNTPQGLHGIQQIAASTGTFEGINRGTAGNEFWHGTDGRDGNTTVIDLAEPVLDEAEIIVEERTGKTPAFYIGDPRVIARYAETHLTLQRFGPEDGENLNTGFKFVSYKGKPLYLEHAHKKGALHGLSPDDYTMYARGPAPDWDELDGSMWRRFTRALPVEAVLVDELQLGAHRCDTTVRLYNLNGV